MAAAFYVYNAYAAAGLWLVVQHVNPTGDAAITLQQRITPPK
jgi:hypothetical protein